MYAKTPRRKAVLKERQGKLAALELERQRENLIELAAAEEILSEIVVNTKNLSFRLNAFVAPTLSWEEIVKKSLDSKEDPFKLQVVVNTLFGEAFEDRGETEEPGELLKRGEDYGAELPEGALALTCGVETQNDRLEYEILGNGFAGETWGIEYGLIPGNPSGVGVWAVLDHVIDKRYRLKSGLSLKISATFVDSGGHKRLEVYEAFLGRHRAAQYYTDYGQRTRGAVSGERPIWRR
ncbi:MAG: phage terminase large subunit family protein [Oscillospiraceae bacterium]|nr:phage terminase large subunit family protein [Oscillospiraceae bacterium]